MNTAASLIIHNARIVTMNARRPQATALAVAGDRVLAVGDEHSLQSYLGRRSEVVDAGGRLVLPGLIDSHFHLLLGARALGSLQLDGAADLDECLDHVRHFAIAQPDREWITGRGWRYALFRNASIDRQLLDAIVPDRPVYLSAFDGHTAWANTAALQRAGILHGANTGSTFSMVVMRDDGTASGELRESSAMKLVQQHIPAPTREDDARMVRAALNEVAALGVTSVHNMDGDEGQLQLYREFAARDELSLRVYLPLSISPGMDVQRIDTWAAQNADLRGPLLRTGCVKLFIDGVVESKTALLLAPYADGSDDCGVANYEREEFFRLIAHADALGQQVFVHAIGDGAVRLTLDAYEAAQRSNGVRDSRHRVEHVELLDRRDLPRFAELGVIAAMQPLHVGFGYDEHNSWRRLAGSARWPLGFAWRTLRDAGARLAFGSDWPVVSPDPLRGIVAAQNRIKLDFSAPGSDFPDQRITLAETIAAYTTDGAYAEFMEYEKGQLAPGMLADLVILSENLFALPPEDLGQARVEMTVLGGRVIYAR